MAVPWRTFVDLWDGARGRNVESRRHGTLCAYGVRPQPPDAFLPFHHAGIGWFCGLKSVPKVAKSRTVDATVI